MRLPETARFSCVEHFDPDIGVLPHFSEQVYLKQHLTGVVFARCHTSAEPLKVEPGKTGPERLQSGVGPTISTGGHQMSGQPCTDLLRSDNGKRKSKRRRKEQ